MTEETQSFNWMSVLRVGLLGGVIALFIALVKLIEPFAARNLVSAAEQDLISGDFAISIGRAMLVTIALAFGFLNARRNNAGRHSLSLLSGLTSGLMMGLVLALYLLVNSRINLRAMFINASPALDAELTLGQESLGVGILYLLVMLSLSGLAGGVLNCVPASWRGPILYAAATAFLLALLEDRVKTGPLGHEGWPEATRRFLYATSGLTVKGALSAMALVGGLIGLWHWRGQTIRERYRALPAPAQQSGRIILWIAIIAFLLTFPFTFQKGLTEIAVIVGYFTLMGLGLNIVVGFAGLLDLGYVAFFAIGAYTTALLTSQGPLGIAGWTFWQALPVAILVSVTAGILLGVPVLRMRGDYLAIVTLGFGEIIKILAKSDLLKNVIGGAQGILTIPKPPNPLVHLPFFRDLPLLGEPTLAGPEQLYYLVILGVLIALFISSRVKDSRMGRAWMAMREDEDVAEAMGIDLVRYKLLAFAIGAALSGTAGAIFATKIGSIFPNSFELLISINVLSLIIIGGIGSLPGVIVGALLLVGLPELLREFQELRLLLFGALLVAMMLLRPEGFIPEAVRRRELHGRETLLKEGQTAAAGTD